MSLANMHTTSDSAQELHNNLCPNILKMLRKYNDLNGQLPSRIILYRDGVGDGQISYVVDHEVKAIKVRLSLSLSLACLDVFLTTLSSLRSVSPRPGSAQTS